MSASLAPLMFVLLPLGPSEGASFLTEAPPEADGRLLLTAESWSLRLPHQELSTVRFPAMGLSPSGEAGATFTLILLPSSTVGALRLSESSARAAFIRGPTDGRVYDNFAITPGDETTRTFPLDGLTTVTVTCETACLAFVTPRASPAVLSARVEALGLPLDPPSEAIPAIHRGKGFRGEVWSPGGASATIALDGGIIEARGDFEVTVTGAYVEVKDSAGTYGFRTGEYRVDEEGHPTESDHAHFRERRFLRIEASTTLLRVAALPPEGATIVAEDPRYHLEGTLKFERARGLVQYNGTARALETLPLELRGRFDVTPLCAVDRTMAIPPPETGCEYRIAGRLDRVLVGGHPLFQRPSAAAAGLAILAALALTLLDRLLGGGDALAGLFRSRLSAEAVLAHPVRARLLALCRGRRAMHFSALSRASGLPPGSLAHHLRILERAGRVRSRAVGGLTLYWAPEGPFDAAHARRVAALKSARARTYARRVLQRPGISQTELADLEGVYRGNVSYHMGKLVAAGLVDVSEGDDGRSVAYRPAAGLWDLINDWEAAPVAEEAVRVEPTPEA